MSDLAATLRTRLAHGLADDEPAYSEAALALAAELAGRSPLGVDDLAPYAGAALLRHVAAGGVCLPLGAPPPGWSAALPAWPTHADALHGHPCIGRPGDYKPLIVDAGHLYLHRLHAYETRLADAFVARSGYHPVSEKTVARLRELFRSNTETPDYQRVAALAALRRDFAIITGGPGTGKTTTVLNLLAALLETEPGLKITLAAPTGKAAARLGETLGRRVGALPVPERTREAIPRHARTLHRILGINPVTGLARHHAKNPLVEDVVLVDEASMIDLPMMARLVDALKPGARLILLGDRDQLASVDVGSVLGDLCAAGEATPHSAYFQKIVAEAHAAPEAGDALRIGPADTEGAPLTDAVVRLVKSRRFSEGSAIGRLCAAFNDGRADDALALLREEEALCAPPARDALEEWVSRRVAAHWIAYSQARTPEEALRRLEHYRLLCALRVGSHGVDTVNTLARALHRRKIDASATLFDGLPFLIRANDASLDLANGDVGVFKKDPESRRILAWIPSADGSPRALAPARLPDWEPAYAMSIHKSQGSEFDVVETLLPPGIHPIMTRELLYTAASRARESVRFVAEEATLRAALTHKVVRPSGLAARLTGR